MKRHKIAICWFASIVPTPLLGWGLFQMLPEKWQLSSLRDTLFLTGLLYSTFAFGLGWWHVCLGIQDPEK